MLSPQRFTLFAGQILHEEWRVVVRGDAVGGSVVRAGAAVRRVRRRAGDRELRALLPGRRAGGHPAPAPQLS